MVTVFFEVDHQKESPRTQQILIWDDIEPPIKHEISGARNTSKVQKKIEICSSLIPLKRTKNDRFLNS